ncbi:hypothetical protein [Actinoplanes sp. NPDC051851]|uniref:hypothetical protein n=1 Tax=Actinoplanes sp. NPDC051851 TaxID=3154753 RepID=UPI0034245BC3
MRFWGIVAESRGDPERLRTVLAGLSRAEVYAFQDVFLEFSAEVRDLVGSGHTEDGADDVADWVVSQGAAAYAAVLAGGPVGAPLDPVGLGHVAYEVYFERFGVALDLM